MHLNNFFEKITQLFWFNTKITKSLILLSVWLEAGIRTILDFIALTGEIYSMLELTETYRVKRVDFLAEYRIWKSLKELVQRSDEG